jgi:hypothetical protein
MSLQTELRNIMVLGGPHGTTEVWTAWDTDSAANEGTKRLIKHLRSYNFNARIAKRYAEPYAGTENRVISISRGGDWYDVWLALCAPLIPPSSNRGVTKND